MRKQKWMMVAGAMASVLASGATQAQGDETTFSQAARIGPTLGLYQGDGSVVIRNNLGGEGRGTAESSWEPLYGLQLGYVALLPKGFFADIGLDLMEVNDGSKSLERTDLLLTAGYFIDSRWSVFGGYRRGMQGDGLFDDSEFSEAGFFLGAGLGGIELGNVYLNASLAYNFSELDGYPEPTVDTDYGGISLKLGGTLKDFPQHGLQLRYQMFSGDDRFLSADPGYCDLGNGGTSCTVDFELEEQYIQLTYYYSFDF